MIVRPLLRRELRDAVRRYWFLANAGTFAVAGLLFVAFAQPEAIVLGSRGYARSLAGLMQLALVFVPLMALVPATAALAAEREAGRLEYLLAQPVTRGDVFLAKWLGVTAGVVLSLVVGFGLTGVVASLRGVAPALFAALLGWSALLAVAFVSIGLAVSAASRSRAAATSVGLTAWLVLLGLGSLGVMSAFVRWGLPAGVLQAWAIVNPVEAFRLAAIALLDADVTVLGAVGSALVEALGRGGLFAAAAASLVGWSAVGLGWGYRRFRRAEL